MPRAASEARRNGGEPPAPPPAVHPWLMAPSITAVLQALSTAQGERLSHPSWDLSASEGEGRGTGCFPGSRAALR